MSMQPDEIAVAEALTLLECRYSKFIYSTYLANIAILKTWLGTAKSPTLPTPTRWGGKPGSKKLKEYETLLFSKTFLMYIRAWFFLQWDWNRALITKKELGSPMETESETRPIVT